VGGIGDFDGCRPCTVAVGSCKVDKVVALGWLAIGRAERFVIASNRYLLATPRPGNSLGICKLADRPRWIPRYESFG
jgi:hypothetical protein